MDTYTDTPSTTSGAGHISSHDVNGTEVYSTGGEHIGHIDHLMIDKASGRVAYAVMGFGGLFGLGEEHHPIPWGSLRYDVGRGGYVTDITKADLDSAPARKDDWASDRDWEARTFDHYRAPYYW